MEDIHARLLHLRHAALFLDGVNPQLSGSAVSRLLLDAHDKEVTLPEGWTEATFCPACRASVLLSCRVKDRRKRRRMRCGACGFVYALPSPSAERKASFPRTNSKAYRQEAVRPAMAAADPAKEVSAKASKRKADEVVEERAKKRPSKRKEGLTAHMARKETLKPTEKPPALGLADFLKAL